MRKSLISLLICLLIIIALVMLFNSLSLGGLQILGLGKLKEKNDELDTSIAELSKLSSTEYQKALKDVSESAKQYETNKETYEQLANISSEGNVLSANQLQKYEIEYLWTRIGGHATKENVVLTMNVSANASSSATGYFDLDFSVSGSYVQIIDFIYAIENDSTLGFKIENFKMSSGSATFKCTNIAINIDASEIGGSNTNTKENSNNTEESAQTTNSNTTDSTSKTDATDPNALAETAGNS